MIAEHLLWSERSLGSALLATARSAKLPHRDRKLSGNEFSGNEAAEQWLESAARSVGLDACSVSADYSNVRQMISQCSPALIRIEARKSPGWLAVIGRRRGSVRVVGPDLSEATLDVRDVERQLRAPLDDQHVPVVDDLLAGLGMSERRKKRARAALLAERLGTTPIEGCWLLRAPGYREVRWGRWLSLLAGAHGLYQVCSITAWMVLGWMTFSGRLELGWLAAWGMLLACTIPLRLIGDASGAYLALEFNASLRRRLLDGTLKLDPDEVRSLGSGGFIGRALEVDALEQLALGGGLQSLLSVIELVSALVVLGPLAGQWWLAGLLMAVIAGSMALVGHNARRRWRWTTERLTLTGLLVERLVGHRTTLAQEPEALGLREADRTIDGYVGTCRKLDESSRWLQILPSRLWLTGSLVMIAPTIVTSDLAQTNIAIALGGILFARQGLQHFLSGLDNVIGAGISWRQLRQFITASRRLAESGEPNLASCRADRTDAGANQDGCEVPADRRPQPDDTVLECRELTFRHARRTEPILKGIGLKIHRRDRILLEGESGGGKSTLASVLAGSRVPSSGVRLLDGLDQPTLGETWRRRVVLAPQFHDNHVLMGTFLYNLLLGRQWPPSEDDASEAMDVCRELELGPLIDRMPGGMLQIVGETGWQLSHGERSRLFLARALLQRSDVVILDESLAALDPLTMQRILPRITERAPALLLVAHP